MNRNEWEAQLSAAKPTNGEIAPLSPEASSRILSAALRENRKRTKRPFWLAAPIRVAISSMVVAAVVYCAVPYVSPSDMPTTQQPPLSAPEMSPVSVLDKTVLVSSHQKTAKTLPKSFSLPVLPSTSPKPVKPQLMVARTSDTESRRGFSRRNSGIQMASHTRVVEHGAAERSRHLPSTGNKSLVGGRTASEGDMFVSVSGDNVLPPEGDSDDTLTIAVKHDVPDTVTGSAEAAALQSVPLPSVTPNPADAQSVPVWTHVRVETGEEPVLTLTALN